MKGESITERVGGVEIVQRESIMVPVIHHIHFAQGTFRWSGCPCENGEKGSGGKGIRNQDLILPPPSPLFSQHRDGLVIKTAVPAGPHPVSNQCHT